MSKFASVFLISTASFLAAAPQPQPFRHALLFEPNQGQTASQVKWLARGPGYQLFLTSEGITMKIREGPAQSLKEDPVAPHPGPDYSVITMRLTGSRPWNNVTGLEPTGGVSNYFNTA